MPNDSRSPTVYRTLNQFRLADLEAIRLVLRGGSVIDWHRLNFESEAQARGFVRAQEFDLDSEADRQRIEQIKSEAISYLRRKFDFPVPKPVAALDLPGLLMLASGKGHRQLCACSILKAMHIIHHLQGRELLFMLPISDQEVFSLVEEKVYRIVGGMLSHGFAIAEFIGGRKNQDSLYTKLLSKPETIAANIYDKLRFRLVTRAEAEIFPVIHHLLHDLFPFNYVIPGQSTNTLFHFRSYCNDHPRLCELFEGLQLAPDLEDELTRNDNRFSAASYRVVHFVVDMPLRIPQNIAERAPSATARLGSVVFAQVEFQIVDRESEQQNEQSDASHAAYKARQYEAVKHRLHVGIDTMRPPSSKGDG
ncbi:MAG: TIGR04552 family protein [Myxococcales bacterium]|nr:TIGR04552 family protein [Myxococcales bacterium]